MKTAILSIGTELLFGQITNTNTVYLSQELNNMGYDVMYHSTVGDNPERLKDTVLNLLKDCDLIITTGGLGPTQDDLSKETVCEVMGDHLVEHEESLQALKKYIKARGRKLTENNYKQAMMPSTAQVFANDQGTAPGFALKKDEKIIICMPGPPREMKNMFVKQVRPYLEKMQDSVIFYRIIRTFGIGESQMETELLPLINGQTDPTIATYAKEGECTLRVASKRGTVEEARRAVDEMIAKVDEIIGQYIYSYDDEPLQSVVGRKLLERNLTISCAESCTGGLFAGSLTDISGISEVFERGIVTYSNRAKMEELGVKKETLDRYGAVSYETAKEMAEGLKEKTGSRIAISVTGIAGPGGGSEEKPVGTVFVCVIFDDRFICRQIDRRNVNRKWNRNFAVLSMYSMINEITG